MTFVFWIDEIFGPQSTIDCLLFKKSKWHMTTPTRKRLSGDALELLIVHLFHNYFVHYSIDLSLNNQSFLQNVLLKNSTTARVLRVPVGA